MVMVHAVNMKTIAMAVMAASLISPAVSQAQTMTSGESVIATGGSIPIAGVYGVVPSYGGIISAGSGYDPMESARNVTNGSQTMIDASMTNTRNAERALSNDSNSSNVSSDDAAQKAAAQKKKTAAEAAAAMGGDLAGDPTQSIMDSEKSTKSTSLDDDAAKAAADQSSMSPEDKARAERVKAALAHADSYLKKPAAGKPTEAASSAPVQKIFSGYAHALDTITLSVSGQTIVLDHLSGPGSQEVCFRDAMPWACGEDGRDVTERAVSGLWMACRLSKGNHGQCYTQDGEDVAGTLLRRGYASRT